jgi:probable HAF family extracellular repeat protein
LVSADILRQIDHKEKIMKSAKLRCIMAMALLVALAIPVSLAAQEHPTQHQQYKLVDLGTLGGPASYYSGQGEGAQTINNHGMFAGYADTSTPDPFAPNCFNPDCFISHTFRWQDGLLTDLGAIADSSAFATINDRGWISGYSQNGLIDPLTGLPETVAVLWKGDQLISLGTLEGGYESVATAVNDSGQVTGFASNLVSDPFFGTQVHVFLWEKGVMTDVGTLGGPDSPPFNNTTVNERGQIAGSSFTNSTPNPVTGLPTTDPFLWEKKKGITDFGTLGGTFGVTADLNQRGQVTGQSNLPGDLTFHSFLWTKPGPMQDLGTLGGDTTTSDRLNDAGDVVGKSDLPGSQTHDGFLWRHGVMTDIGTLPGDPCSRANWINEQRQIVGNSSDCTTPFHAILWEPGGPPIDLNTLIPPNSSLQLTNALDINERGEIAGLGVPAGCQPKDVGICGRVFVLIPCNQRSKGCDDVPESEAPATQSSPRAAAHGAATVAPRSPMPNQGVVPFRQIRGYRTSGGGA